MDNSIVDLEDDAYMVMVDDEEEEESPQKPPANDDEAGPSETTQEEEPQQVATGYTNMFQNLGGEPSSEEEQGLVVVAGPAVSDVMYDGVAVPAVD